MIDDVAAGEIRRHEIGHAVRDDDPEGPVVGQHLAQCIGGAGMALAPAKAAPPVPLPDRIAVQQAVGKVGADAQCVGKIVGHALGQHRAQPVEQDVAPRTLRAGIWIGRRDGTVVAADQEAFGPARFLHEHAERETAIVAGDDRFGHAGVARDPGVDVPHRRLVARRGGRAVR